MMVEIQKPDHTEFFQMLELFKCCFIYQNLFKLTQFINLIALERSLTQLL